MALVTCYVDFPFLSVSVNEAYRLLDRFHCSFLRHDMTLNMQEADIAKAKKVFVVRVGFKSCRFGQKHTFISRKLTIKCTCKLTCTSYL